MPLSPTSTAGLRLEWVTRCKYARTAAWTVHLMVFVQKVNSILQTINGGDRSVNFHLHFPVALEVTLGLIGAVALSCQSHALLNRVFLGMVGRLHINGCKNNGSNRIELG